ncbi:helix-turn-helix domain-containing protein [Mariniphaga sp.]|uniref:helix-turn-helix domain-containing protein n=1 Tax=Mariniphaga sp. TaxID=1954475 RepID=UPI003569DA44
MIEKLYIKNMVCDRCKMVVKAELEKLGYQPVSVELGEVVLEKELSADEKANIDKNLQTLGFSLIDDKKSRLIEKIKSLIIELVHRQNNLLQTNLSDYLSSQLNHDYNYITNLFTEVEGTTIEKYFIAQKIEKVKELLVYDELTLSEIAWQLNYSSVAYLSSQFKKVTGLTPSHFKNIRVQKRKPLDKV